MPSRMVLYEQEMIVYEFPNPLGLGRVSGGGLGQAMKTTTPKRGLCKPLGMPKISVCFCQRADIPWYNS